jgi:hypothetical protein
MDESDYFKNMIKRVKDFECCALPVGFDDEVNHLDMMKNVAAYRWVCGETPNNTAEALINIVCPCRLDIESHIFIEDHL